MVGRGGGGVFSGSCPRISKELSLGSQRMDGSRPYHGLDQHENYFRFCLLSYRDPYRNVQAVARKRSHGATFESRPRQLSHYPQAPTAIPSNKAILRFYPEVSHE
jgi:hypothetical protein